MKITVDLPEADLREICRLTGQHKKGPAIRQLLDDALRLRKRAEISAKFLTGEWSAELEGFESAKVAERREVSTLAEQWRS